MPTTKDKPAAKQKAAAAEKKPAEPGKALVATFPSHGQIYTIIRIPRHVGENLKKGTTYDVKEGAGGVLTLTPSGEKAAPKARRASHAKPKR